MPPLAMRWCRTHKFLQSPPGVSLVGGPRRSESSASSLPAPPSKPSSSSMGLSALIGDKGPSVFAIDRVMDAIDSTDCGENSVGETLDVVVLGPCSQSLAGSRWPTSGDGSGGDDGEKEKPAGSLAAGGRIARSRLSAAILDCLETAPGHSSVPEVGAVSGLDLQSTGPGVVQTCFSAAGFESS